MWEAPIFRPGPGADPSIVAYAEDGLKRESSAPCQLKCPSGIDIPSCIALIGQGRFEEAVEVMRLDNPFPWVCGIVCPNPCENWCQRRHLDKPLCIKDLKAVAAKYTIEKGQGYKNPNPKNHYKERVAVVGSGPAGLTAAYFLALEGYKVTVFESMKEAGGLLIAGIPEFRLPRDIVRREIAAIQDLGVEIVLNTPVGSEDLSLDDLRKDGYKAFFLGVGAWHGLLPSIECDYAYPQLIDGLTFLKDVSFGNKIKPANAVAIIGGGNAAIDAARTCTRLGCQSVSILYRRTRSEMPAHFEEIVQAAEEGIHFHQLTVPMKIIGSYGKIDSVECVMTNLGELDESGRRRPVPVPNSEYKMPVGAIISAVGQRPDVVNYPGFGELKLNDTGTIDVRGNSQQTNIPDVFSGGDAVTGPSTVIEAIAAGKRAARAIHARLRGEKLQTNVVPRPHRMIAPIRLDYHEKAFIQRQEIPMIDLDRRMHTFDQVELGLDEKAAMEEAKRCMRCDVCERCGKCVEICTQILGKPAIQFYHAGESSLILKDYVHGLPHCLGCGACVNVCPTGALQIEDHDGERLLLMCGTIINRLHMLKCEACGTSFVTRGCARRIEGKIKDVGWDIQVKLCPECRRAEQASKLVGFEPDYGSPELWSQMTHKTIV